jgi:hypothetical protein
MASIGSFTFARTFRFAKREAAAFDEERRY